MRSLLTRPLDRTEILTFHFVDDGRIPNHPTLPMIVYRAVLQLDARDPAVTAEQLFAQHGWQGTWRNGIFDFAHYHSNAHEVLAICRGEATVRFGGERGQTLVVQAGDVALLPAGTGHQRLSPSCDLLVVGAYPPGQSPDLCRGSVAERAQALASIRQVPLPTMDPLFGAAGPVHRFFV